MNTNCGEKLNKSFVAFYAIEILFAISIYTSIFGGTDWSITGFLFLAFIAFCSYCFYKEND